MYLTASNVYYYLRDTGMVSPSELLDGGLTITEVGRRNRNFCIEMQTGASLFVKQVPAFIPETMISFMREAACAQLAHEVESLTTLRAVIPKIRHYDPARQILIYDLFPDSQGYAETARKEGRIPDTVIEALALILAGVHRETIALESLSKIANTFAGEAPWVFVIAEKAETVMPNMSAGCRQIVDALRATPELYYGLAQLGQQWRTTTLIHGDFKWDNVMVVDDSDGIRKIKLIDWELANRGDPFWDVAGGLVALIQLWLFHQPDTSQAANVQLQPSMPLDLIRQSGARFWRTYTSAFQSGFPSAETMAMHAGQLTAARLVLLAFEIAANSTVLSFHASAALQLARYFFTNPLRALSDFLGIEPIEGNPSIHYEINRQSPWVLPPAEVKL